MYGLKPVYPSKPGREEAWEAVLIRIPSGAKKPSHFWVVIYVRAEARTIQNLQIDHLQRYLSFKLTDSPKKLKTGD